MRFVNTGKFQNNLFSLLSFTSEGFLYTKSKKEGNWKEYDTAGHFVKTIKYEKGNQK